ncbi:MAG: 30S ribosomal protein S8 [Nanopusillaceae archaeon]
MVDIINDFLSHLTNSINVGKKEVVFNYYSKLLLNVLEKMKEKGYIESYEVVGRNIKVKVSDSFNFAKAIKPRFPVSYRELEKYEKRYLPARGMGILLVSTSKGIKTNDECKKEKIGGVLVAVVY